MQNTVFALEFFSVKRIENPNTLFYQIVEFPMVANFFIYLQVIGDNMKK